MAVVLIRALRNRNRPARQDGFALIVVLVATLVFGLIVVALLSMAMTSLAVRGQLSSAAAAQRAADAALETWINELKTDPGGVLGRQGQPCDSGPLDMDTLTVTVRCLGETPAGTPIPTGMAGNTSLTLLGGFTGPIPDLAAAPSAVATLLGPQLKGLAASLSPTFPGFIHYGPKTLEIDGDVRVKQDGLVWHEQEGVGIAGPAVSINGKYQQGKTSFLFGRLDFLFRRTPECGLLDRRFDRTWSDLPLIGTTLVDSGFHIAATEGLSCNGSNVVTDPNWPAPTPSTPWSAERLRAGMGLPAACDDKKPDRSTPVVRLDPGMYNRDDTAILNKWLKQGNCDGVTFWFPPGDYYFDAAGIVAGDINTRSAIVVNDLTSNVVFGTPAGWDPTKGKAPDDAFPSACSHDGSQPGVTITMSPRTTLKHFNGLLSACSDHDADGREKPLLYQATGADEVRWAGVPTEVTPTRFADAGRALRSTAASKPADWPANAGTYDTSEPSPEHSTALCEGMYSSCTPRLTFKGFSDPAAYAYGDPKSAEVHIRGTADNVAGNLLGLGSRTVVRVTFGDGSGSCTTTAPDVPRGEMTIDLLNPDVFALAAGYRDLCGKGTITDVAQLDGATVDVTLITGRDGSMCGPWYNPRYCDYSVGIDYAWLEATAGNTPPSIAHTTVDPAAPQPTSMTLYGPVYLPRTQVVVDWRGEPNLAPIFGGGLVARALASGIDFVNHPTAKPGKLAGLSRVAGERKVDLAAVIGGRVRATATVRIVDSQPDGRTLSPGRQVEILDWRTCNAEVSTTAAVMPQCDAPG